jgi:hypothetical protein
VTVIDGKIDPLIEVKLSDEKISTSLKYYHDKLQPKETIQIVKSLRKAYDKDGIRVTTAEDYFSKPIW